jgi:phenylalanyl-tRNA synthetase beta chain
MRVNIEYLKKFINIDTDKLKMKNLLASIGLEVSELITCNGKDIFDVEITPNRPDWLSHYGIARDIHSKLQELKFSPLKFPEVHLDKQNEDFLINIEDINDCPRYTGCIVRDIKVNESSKEVKELIESFGLRPINNIVDISNLALMTIGQPIHIFDLDKIYGNEINVRRALNGESLELLDGQKISLNNEFLVICDEKKPVAIAGIMGGESSGVTFETRNIFIESAYFNPVIIRRGARKLGIKTEASYRFERGADVLVTQKAVSFVLEMIKKVQKQELNITYYNDVFKKEFKPIFIELSKDYPSIYTGIKIKDSVSEQILRNLGFKLENKGDKWIVEVPSYRIDIFNKQDLVEEIIRIYGYDKLSSKLPLCVNENLRTDNERELINKIRYHLTSIGFNEVINYIFHSYEENKLFSDRENFLEIKNPIGRDFSVLRNSLIPGLLKNSALNFNNSIKRVSLFEFGKRFYIKNEKIREEDILSLSASGIYLESNWKEPIEKDFDFYIFKSLFSTMLKKIHIKFKLEKNNFPHLLDECSYLVKIDEHEIGYIGSLKKEIIDFYKIDKPVFVVEVQLSKISKYIKENSFKMWNKFPFSKRDFSFLIDKNIDYYELESVMEKLKPAIMERYELFDLYEGNKIPANKVSFSMAFYYRSKKRTLTSDEINDTHIKFTEKLIKKLDLIQR